MTDQLDENPDVQWLEPTAWQRGQITDRQHDYLMQPLASTRVAKRSQGGRELSYLEAWDVRAHLIRVFGFGNFDAEVTSVQPVFVRDYKANDKAMQEIAYLVTLRLVIRAADGTEVARYTEAAVGSASGGSGYGDLHDNAVKQAASDALKRCAINLGTQFGLSLYNDGSRQEVVRNVLVRPAGATKGVPPSEAPQADLRPDQQQTLQDSLGATVVSDTADPAPEDGPAEFTNQANNPAEAEAALAKMEGQSHG